MSQERLTEIQEELRRSLGLKTKEEVDYSVCSHAVQIIADTCCLPAERIIKQLTDWAWDEEEAGEILRLTTDKGDSNGSA